MKKRLIAVTALAALAVALSGCTAPAGAPTTSSAEPQASPVQTPTPEATKAEPDAFELPEGPPAGTEAAIAWEALMSADGEYAASASYLAVIEKFGEVEPYVSIQQAEQRHSDALIRQLKRLGVEAPENPYLTQIAAPDSLEKAAHAWAEGEVANIAMYDNLLTQSNDSNLIRVLTNLRNASADSHLPAFEAAAAQGGTLTADQMSTYLGRR